MSVFAARKSLSSGLCYLLGKDCLDRYYRFGPWLIDDLMRLKDL